MPAPVLLPSQITNDRMLSISDAIFDALVSAFLIFFIIYAGINTFTVVVGAIAATYWAFHIIWWQETLQWGNVHSLKEYIFKTYVFYVSVFSIVFLISLAGSVYLIEKNNLIEFPISERIKNTTAGKVFDNYANVLSAGFSGVSKQYESPAKVGIFTREKMSKQKESLDVERKEVDLSLTTIFYLKYTSGIIIFLAFSFMIGYYYRGKYLTVRDKISREAARDLNNSLKNVQNDLREALG
jgi:hypothetical protein